jgi:hypothetical protein
MPIRVQKFFVAICPTCGNRIDLNGDGGFSVFTGRKEIREHLDDNLGRAWAPLDEQIAEACGDKCWRKFRGLPPKPKAAK